MFVFFFSSRRRHTRCSRDWSSDVCSSDLHERQSLAARAADQLAGLVRVEQQLAGAGGRRVVVAEIGRASWRGRGEISGVGGSLKKKKEKHRTYTHQTLCSIYY